ncbi:hypothetical protein [Dactylosporangium matsuzakiense]|uniref:Uncharacterized protein n=1 Tax=Dactylosporangium matsuzakiense TaxID=53360 RepID=A0A9W6NLR2_9ACTN|nr:hypothetical protein [Dactylosporangium matsuzakiense]UWZ47313.1 hypothetical protein Dmats_13435 [Dactylosporangium matsuzakiense]GLL01363.1 hypothetical protein GCM10017581_031040 [Dactylosporangium matsuzakiense]
MGDAHVLDRLDITRLLERLTAGFRANHPPAGRPYRHVNGFTKIVAAEHPDGSRLTLHYWPADPLAGEHVSRPHDHRFPFSSILLGGHQHFIELTESQAATSSQATDSPQATGSTWRRFTYQPYAGGRVAFVRQTGVVALEPFRTVERAPLQGRYEITATVIHQAVTDRTHSCATLVLRGPREKRTSNVYYRPTEPSPSGGLQLGRRLTHTEVVRQLEEVRTMLT